MTKKALAAFVLCFALASGIPVFWALEGRPGPSRQRVYSIGAYEGTSLGNLLPAENNPVIHARHVMDANARYTADPFLFRKGNELFMFFEFINEDTKHGDIGLATSRDGLSWTYLKTALDEPFHLSFPFVFEWQGACYMVPEANETGTVRLYRAEPFPGTWRYVKVLINSGFVDPALIRHDGLFWLFCSKGDADLHLFSATDLLGSWQEHPRSPIIAQDASKGRMGGRVLESKGRLYRIAQVDTPDYGMGLRAFEIVRLTKSDYEEREVFEFPHIHWGSAAWNRLGMHHFDALEFNGRWVAVADGWTRRILFGNFNPALRQKYAIKTDPPL